MSVLALKLGCFGFRGLALEGLENTEMSTLIGLNAQFLPVRIKVLSVPQVGLPVSTLTYIFNNTSMFALNLAIERLTGGFVFAWFVILKHSKPIPDGANLFWTHSKCNLSQGLPCLAVTDKSLFALTTQIRNAMLIFNMF